MNNPVVDRLLTFVTTGFGVGYLPLAPGTFGALWGIPIFLVYREWPGWLQIIFLLLFTLIAVALSDREERKSRQIDPGYAVIDEAVGTLFTLFFIWRGDWPVIIVGFLLFRAFDVIKFFPLNLFENFRGGMGMVMDDVAAGMFANLCLRVILLAGIL